MKDEHSIGEEMRMTGVDFPAPGDPMMAMRSRQIPPFWEKQKALAPSRDESLKTPVVPP
jgi:hypothetical protein